MGKVYHRETNRAINIPFTCSPEELLESNVVFYQTVCNLVELFGDICDDMVKAKVDEYIRSLTSTRIYADSEEVVEQDWDESDEEEEEVEEEDEEEDEEEEEEEEEDSNEEPTPVLDNRNSSLSDWFNQTDTNRWLKK